MNRKPVDDVWIRGRYPPQCHALEECVQRHKEYAHPSMFDNMDGLVYADLELNMSTKKKVCSLSLRSGGVAKWFTHHGKGLGSVPHMGSVCEALFWSLCDIVEYF